MDTLTLIECPRDAWQGLPRQIPTAEKVAYLRMLIDSGFRHIDAVSFVSPKYVPQMADSEAVMAELAGTVAPREVDIIGIVVNEKGLERALATTGVSTIGYPHSLSPAFLQSNAHLTLEQSRQMLDRISERTRAAGRGLVVYLSMAFGNPYGDAWSEAAVAAEVQRLVDAGARQISLADTVGLAAPGQIRRLLETVLPRAARAEIGVHLHSRAANAAAKISAAWQAGCRRFDAALTGLGGCPFAGDELVGNIPTEIVLGTIERNGTETGIAPEPLARALEATALLRAVYAHAP